MNGPLVTKPEHDKAVFAGRVLYEIGDEDIWKLRAALRAERPREDVIAGLEAKLRARYGKDGDTTRRIGLYRVDWKFICQLIGWS